MSIYHWLFQHWVKVHGPLRGMCVIGMHHWDFPGGHCEECGSCDLLLEPSDHEDCA